MRRTEDSIREDLIKEIEKCRKILDGLHNNESYIELVKDFENAAREIDNVWHLQNDLTKLQEMRITKMAAVTLVHALDSYKYSLEKSSEQLAKLNEEE